MREMLAFAVFDEKAAVFQPPFFFPTRGMAIRTFADTVQNPQSHLARHAGDFKLYQVGKFNEHSGELEGSLPEFICVASDFVKEVAHVGSGA